MTESEVPPGFVRGLVAVATIGTLAAGIFVACGPVHRPDGGYGLLAVGQSAPDFAIPDQTGKVRTFAEFKGRIVVLYFYPKDDTPGCTKEACTFRDVWSRFDAAGAQLLGVSKDDVASHAKFASTHTLPFPLLADSGGAVLKAYGVNSTLGFASRVTFVIDRTGKIAKVFRDVDPASHASEVLHVVETLAK